MMVAFRCDASERIGGGHVMRCRALAAEFAQRGARCVFLTAPETACYVADILASDFQQASVNDDEPYALAAIPGGRPDLLVVDHYELDARWERAALAHAGALLTIDDVPVRTHHCTALLDQTLGRDPAAYAALVPTGARLLAGSRYALLRPEFAAARPAATGLSPSGPIRRVLIAPGYADARGLAVRTLEAVGPRGCDVDIVVGHDDAALANLRRAATRFGTRVNIHKRPPDIVRLMLGCDLAIASAGSASWERCCLGVPSIVVSVADNQAEIARALADVGAAVNAGSLDPGYETRLAAALDAMNARTLSSMRQAALAVCDGQGASRVAAAFTS